MSEPDDIGTDLRDADSPKLHKWTWMSVDDFEHGLGEVYRVCEKCGLIAHEGEQPDERCLPLPQPAA